MGILRQAHSMHERNLDSCVLVNHSVGQGGLCNFTGRPIQFLYCEPFGLAWWAVQFDRVAYSALKADPCNLAGWTMQCCSSVGCEGEQ